MAMTEKPITWWQLTHDREHTWHLLTSREPEPFGDSTHVCGWEPPVQVTLQTSTNLETLNCAACKAHPLYAEVLRTERDWIDAELAKLPQ